MVLSWPNAAPHHAGASANAINVMSDVASIVNSVRVMLILISFFVLLLFSLHSSRSLTSRLVELTRTASAIFLTGCALLGPPGLLAKGKQTHSALVYQPFGGDLFESWETHVVNKHTRNLVIGFYVER